MGRVSLCYSTIVAGLGSSGVSNGVFRKHCQNCLERLVANQDLLLVVMEVFLWDPLSRWAALKDRCAKNFLAQKAILEMKDKLALRDSYHATGLLNIPEGVPVIGKISDEERRAQFYWLSGVLCGSFFAGKF